MKKLLALGLGLMVSSIGFSQEISTAEALRYSSENIQGTARFRAMSGAFGALGGDMSAVNINPAGSVVFANSHGSLSLGVFDNQNDVSYFGNTTSNNETQFDINQFGVTFNFRNTNQNSKWKKFALSLAYDQTANFDNDWVANGVNPDNSIANYFLTYANGLPLSDISVLEGETISEAYSQIGSIFGFRNQQAFLGYESFILDPLNNTDSNTSYTSNINGEDFNQNYIFSSRGYNGKAAFNFAVNYDDKLSLGLNLNAHFIDYERSTLLNESNNNTTSSVRNVVFENNLRTYGSGFSFQLGTIAKITDALRLGLSYRSPTWYRISDETSQGLRTTRIEGGNNVTQLINPNVINIYDEYRLRSPGKITGSLAYVFGQKGLLSFDYSRKDFGNIEFRPTTDLLFANLNTQIRQELTNVNSYRLGGEYRIKQLSLRAGYRFEDSPYKDTTIMSDLTGYSLGLGYNFGVMTLDLAFSQTQQEVGNPLYSVGLTDRAQIDTNQTDVILTLGFSL